MRFATHKRRQAPTVIIISLIDVLLVVLIFLMVTTTFKKQPSVKLALPESKQSKAGANESVPMVITVPKSGPIYLDTQPVTFEKLQARLVEAMRQNPETSLSINAD